MRWSFAAIALPALIMSCAPAPEMASTAGEAPAPAPAPAPSPAPAQPEAAAPAAAAPAQATLTPADEERALATVQTKCSACHALHVLIARPHYPDDWPEILNDMVGRGASLSDEEFQLVQTYLQTRLSYEPPVGGDS